MLGLCGQSRSVLLVLGCILGRSGARRDPTLAAVEGRVILVHLDGVVVDVGHAGDADVGDGAIVIERSATPLAADKTHASVAESVVDAAVKSDVRTPISGMPGIESAAPAPPAWSPQHTDRGHDPGAGNPVVSVVVTPAPIAWGPHISGPRTERLRVHRKRGRSKAYRYTDCNLRG